MVKSFLISFLFFLIGTFDTYSQLEKLDYEQQLLGETASQNTVIAILQDQQGFMWFGTREGLYRFDGYYVKTFKREYNNPNSLTDDYIPCLMEDSQGNIWIATRRGLNKYDPKSDTFCVYEYDKENPRSISENSISAIYEDKDGFIWIGTYGGGLNKLDPQTEYFTIYRHDQNNPNSIQQDYITDITEDGNGILWIGLSGYGVDRFDKEEEKFTNYQIQLDNPTKTFRSNVVRDLFDDGRGNLWIATYFGLNKLQKANGNFTHWEPSSSKPNSFKSASFNSIVKNEKDNLRISTYGGGIYKFDLQTETFVFAEDLNEKVQNLFTVYRDQMGILWLGTDGGGVYRYYDHPKFNFVSIPDMQSYIAKISIDNKGRKWFGTLGQGLFKINNDSTIQQFSTSNGLSQNIVSSIAQDLKGNLWIGTDAAGLNLYDPETANILVYRYQHGNPKSLYHDSVFTTYVDPQGGLWIGTAAGLSFFDESGKHFIREKLSAIRDILRIDDKLWVATDKGLKIYDIEAHTLKSTSQKVNTAGILHRKINCLFNSNKGAVYIGTEGGLYLFEPNTSSFVDLHKIYNIPYVKIMAIEQDQYDNLWLLTGKGLMHLDTTAKTFEIFDKSDGMVFNSFYKALYFDSSKNEILVGGIGGYYAFNPDDIVKNTHQPPLVLTDIKILNKPVDIGKMEGVLSNKAINFIEEISLSHKENMISFEFAALNYQSPEKNQYAYKLQGFNDDWVYTDANRRFATYTNLDPGNYTFMAKGSNNDGVWGDSTTPLKLTINPPPWKTWWAYTLYMMAILVALLLARRQIINREKLKNKLQLEHLALEKMQEIDTLKSRFFTNISHEFRTPLTLIIGPLKKIISKTKTRLHSDEQKDLDIMYRNSERLLRLTNQLLDLSRLEAGKLTLVREEKEIIQLIRVAITSFNSLADQKHVHFEQNIPTVGCVAMVDQGKLENIIYNLLSNAFKFTPENGSVSVDILLNENPLDNKLSIIVKDTGTGIGKNDLDKIFDRFYRSPESVHNEIEGTGIGLALTKELVTLMGGTITVESLKDKGTSFNIILPIEVVGTTPLAIGDMEKDSVPIIPTTEIEESVIVPDSLPIILIAEDDADLRYYIKECLGIDEYRFMEAKNGKEGFEKAKEVIPDIIVSDLMMPEMDGLMFCELVKKDEHTNHIPFIMLTAKASEENQIEGLETGADDYITKPFDATSLQLKIKNSIRQQSLLQERLRKELLLEPVEKNVLSEKERFVSKLKSLIEKHIDNTVLSVGFLSSELAVSRVQLYRKTQALTGLSPTGFVRMIRLKKAAQLLRKQWNNVSEIAYAVGFDNLSYFTKCFRDMYGKTPSEYMKIS